MRVLSFLAGLTALAPCFAHGAPVAAVMVTRRIDVAAKDAQAVADSMAAALAEQRVARLGPAEVSSRIAALQLPDSAACDGSKDCVLTLGKRLEVPVVVAVEVGGLGKRMAVHLEAWRLPDGMSLGSKELVAANTRLRPEDTQKLQEFAQKLAVQIAIQLPPVAAANKVEPAKDEGPNTTSSSSGAGPAADLPRQPKEAELVPPPPAPISPPPVEVVAGSDTASKAASAESSSDHVRWQRVAAYALLGVAVAAGGVAVYEHFHASDIEKEMEGMKDGQGFINKGNPVRYNELQAAWDTASNLRLGLSIGAGVLAAAGVGAFVWSVVPERDHRSAQVSVAVAGTF